MQLKQSIDRNRPNSTVVLILLLAPVFADQLTGFLQKELSVDFSFSQILKSLYTAGFIIFLFLKSPKGAVVIAIFLTFYVLHFCLTYFSAPERSYLLVADIPFFAKLITFPLCYFVFQVITNYAPQEMPQFFLKIHVIIFVTLSAAVMLSVFGFGDVNYGMDESTDVAFGYKGYFIAGNELSALYIVAYTYWLHFCYTRSRNILLLTGGILAGGITAGLIVTKTALASFAVITLLQPVLLGVYTALHKHRFVALLTYIRRMLGALSIVLVLLTSFAMVLFGDRITANLDRMEENLEKADNINSFLLSGRNERLEHSWYIFKDKYTATEKLFGGGWEYPQTIVKQEFLGVGTTEIDYLDILISYGLIGLLLFYGFWAYIFVRLIRSFFTNPVGLIVPALTSFSLLLMNSFISGHILYSALAGFYLAVMPNLSNYGQQYPSIRESQTLY